MGHKVKLIPAEFAKTFNIRNKSDVANARAIWLAVQQQGKPVAVKTETQQAMLALHRMRQQLIKFRTMQVNNLRGLLRTLCRNASDACGTSGCRLAANSVR